MKKIISLITIFAVLFSFSACKSDNNVSAESKSETDIITMLIQKGRVFQ